MPDLITHTVAAYLIRKRSIAVPDIIIYLFGAMLPDLTTRPFMIIFPAVRHFFHAFHTPVALLLIIYLISQYFEENLKQKVFRLLSYGALTHLFLDWFQASVGERSYSWLFPFSYWDFQVGLFWPEDSVTILPIVVGVFLIDFYYTRKSKNNLSDKLNEKK